ncbi:MAG: hypothetical protein ACQES2_02015 [Pseudomonadota bacterium]
MKRFIFFKLIPMVVIAIGFATYALYFTTGQTPWTAVSRWQGVEANLSAAAKSNTVDQASRAVERATQLAAERVIFRWYTEDGGLVYGDEPPKDARRVELLRAKDLSPLTVITPKKIVVENEQGEPASEDKAPVVQAGPAGGMELLKEAKNLKQQIEQRYRDQGMLPAEEE